MREDPLLVRLGAPPTAAVEGALPPAAAAAGQPSACALLVGKEEAADAAPVFASGDAALEQRLLRSFGALRLPQVQGSNPPPASSFSASASAVDTPEEQLAAAAPKSQLAGSRPAAAAAAGAAADGAAEEVTASTGRAAAVHSHSSVASASAAPPPAANARQHRVGCAAEAAEGEPSGPVAAAPAAAAAERASAAAGAALQGGQGYSGSRDGSSLRADSPGAWSEATDSTGCTDSSDVVRPPAFGSWRHYSLADVPEEAMGLRGMQMACELMLQQRRQAAAAAAEAGGGDCCRGVLHSEAPPWDPSEGPPEDPRVFVGPRRREEGEGAAVGGEGRASLSVCLLSTAHDSLSVALLQQTARRSRSNGGLKRVSLPPSVSLSVPLLSSAPAEGTPLFLAASRDQGSARVTSFGGVVGRGETAKSISSWLLDPHRDRRIKQGGEGEQPACLVAHTKKSLLRSQGDRRPSASRGRGKGGPL
ncbi:hypothetical protein Efla_001835 [Eimeria flavescens]